jgi:hypothetical protein
VLPRFQLLAGVITVLTLAAVPSVQADEATPDSCPLLRLFLSVDDPAPTSFRALRHLEARNEKFDRTAWMDVWTEASDEGFVYTIVAEGGSEYIRKKVLQPTLDAERKMWRSHLSQRTAITPDNYTFEDPGASTDGLATLAVKARRKDMSLIDGVIYIRPGDGELVKSEGRLTKAPSFWTRHVEITRHYRRLAGIRMPVAVESVANVLIAGRSTFSMTYEYESINGQRVGTPQVRTTDQQR